MLQSHAKTKVKRIMKNNKKNYLNKEKKEDKADYLLKTTNTLGIQGVKSYLEHKTVSL